MIFQNQTMAILQMASWKMSSVYQALNFFKFLKDISFIILISYVCVIYFVSFIIFSYNKFSVMARSVTHDMTSVIKFIILGFIKLDLLVGFCVTWYLSIHLRFACSFHIFILFGSQFKVRIHCCEFPERFITYNCANFVW